jgi:hypothetical protein
MLHIWCHKVRSRAGFDRRELAGQAAVAKI